MVNPIRFQILKPQVLQNNMKNKFLSKIHSNRRKSTQLSCFPVQERFCNKCKQIWTAV